MQSKTKHKPRIKRLTPELANQIAAGEVIERPASVLKELLENSIDAGSSSIEILIEKGGFKTIQVQDNGIGIIKEDLALALQQHATSKIFSLNDLENVKTLGFRGEALASISSVSRFMLSSFVLGEESGFGIRREGRDGQMTLLPSPSVPGTKVTVSDLFYNTPARRKFLRSERTEMLHIEEVFKAMALSQPKIQFVLRNEEKILKRLPAGGDKINDVARIRALCGENFVDNACFIQAENNGLKLWGWLGLRSAFRASQTLQYFYINGRIVRDKLVNHAIREAYANFQIEAQYPAYVLFFELEETALDVNVHPTKHEVRFRDARSVHAFLSYSIRKALEESEADLIQHGIMQDANSTIINSNINSTFKRNCDFRDEEYKINKNRNDDNTLFNAANVNTYINNTTDGTDTNANIKKDNLWHLFHCHVLKGELIFLEDNEKIWVLDLNALCQSYIKEYLQSAYANEINIEQSLVLFPKKMVLPNVDVEKHLCSHEKSIWEKLGFEFQILGKQSFTLRKIPLLCKPLNIEDEEKIIQLLKCETLDETLDFIAMDLAAGPLSLELAEQNFKLFDEAGLLDDFRKALDCSVPLSNKAKEHSSLKKNYFKEYSMDSLRNLLLKN